MGNGARYFVILSLVFANAAVLLGTALKVYIAMAALCSEVKDPFACVSQHIFTSDVPVWTLLALPALAVSYVKWQEIEHEKHKEEEERINRALAPVHAKYFSGE